ncbi:MAG TPA: PorV/PorQ family protein [Gemmatimonadales bacterium]
MRGPARAARALLAAALGALAVAAPRLSGAQDALPAEGALFLLLPVGARAVASGGAVVAASEGSESLWWNPASLARQVAGEVAVHHAQTIAATSDALAAVFPWRGVGVFGVAAHLIDLGEQEITPPDGPPAIGKLLPRNVVVSASYARRLGTVLDLGLTYKVLQVRSDCSGQCANVPVGATTSSAADIGARLHLRAPVPVVVGVALRNVGPDIRLHDRTERDPLPTRWQLGLGHEVRAVERYASDLTLHVGADVVADLDSRLDSYRAGGEVAWQRRVILRGGYVFDAGSGASGEGPTVGLGVVAGRLAVDIAREFQGLSADAGQPPTYVTLRYRF